MAPTAVLDTSQAVRDPRVRVTVDEPERNSLHYFARRVADVANLLDDAIDLAGPLMLDEWDENGAILDGVTLTAAEARQVRNELLSTAKDSFSVVSVSYGSPFTTILEFACQEIVAKAIAELVIRLVDRARRAGQDVHAAWIAKGPASESRTNKSVARELRRQLGGELVPQHIANRLHRHVRLAVWKVVIELETETTRETTITTT